MTSRSACALLSFPDSESDNLWLFLVRRVGKGNADPLLAKNRSVCNEWYRVQGTGYMVQGIGAQDRVRGHGCVGLLYRLQRIGYRARFWVQGGRTGPRVYGAVLRCGYKGHRVQASGHRAHEEVLVQVQAQAQVQEEVRVESLGTGSKVAVQGRR